jgi:hypothetical protein
MLSFREIANTKLDVRCPGSRKLLERFYKRIPRCFSNVSNISFCLGDFLDIGPIPIFIEGGLVSLPLEAALATFRQDAKAQPRHSTTCKMKRRMLSPNITSIQQRTFSRGVYYNIFFGNAFNLFRSLLIFGSPDAYERVVRPHDHDMTRCTVWIVSRLRHHISRLWRFVQTKYAPSGNCIRWICPLSGARRILRSNRQPVQCSTEQHSRSNLRRSSSASPERILGILDLRPGPISSLASISPRSSRMRLSS